MARGRLILLVVAALLFSGPVLAADFLLQVEGIRYGAVGTGTRIVFDLSQKADFRAFALDNPLRIVVDLPQSEWNTAKSRFVTSTIVRSYRSGVLEDGLTRVIFDIKKPALVDNIFSLPKDGFNKDRVVVDLKPVSLNLFNARKGEVSGNPDLKGSGSDNTPTGSGYENVENNIVKSAVVSKPPVVTSSLKKAAKKYTIVVDAGHGGEDPGASGQGVKEKFITLKVAAELKRQLEETGRYKVVMTRDRDFYIKLYERVDISRRVGGDLFVSIHADKIDRKGVRGASIYTLSEKASDAESARLAEDENNAGFVAGVDLSQETQDVADILLDLAMRDKMNESNLFAGMLKQAFQRKSVRLLPNSHRSAGFAVLKAPDVPSVLIETGFISNPDEAKLLDSAQFQRNISAAIVDGVDTYFRKIQSLQKR